MPDDLRIAVLGAGLIGQQHILRVAREPGCVLAGVVDPAQHAESSSRASGAPWFPDLATMLATEKPDAVIVATPNQTHEPVGLECIAAGLPMLVEKPLAEGLASGRRLVEAAEAAAVPLLVGHHRRHSATLKHAKSVIESGRLGRIAVVNALAWFAKPDGYFDVAWRREPGGGPILINLIHVMDDLRYLCGEIDEVRATRSNAMRLFPVEDSATALVTFHNGALGTVSISDTAAAPWSWELTAGENPAYPETDQACYLIGGTNGSLSIPTLDEWHHEGPPDWRAPIARSQLVSPKSDPLTAQLQHFCRVVRGDEEPLIDGRDALRTLEVTLAIARDAVDGEGLPPG